VRVGVAVNRAWSAALQLERHVAPQAAHTVAVNPTSRAATSKRNRPARPVLRVKR